jgi:hypothetical protein
MNLHAVPRILLFLRRLHLLLWLHMTGRLLSRLVLRLLGGFLLLSLNQIHLANLIHGNVHHSSLLDFLALLSGFYAIFFLLVLFAHMAQDALIHLLLVVVFTLRKNRT